MSRVASSWADTTGRQRSCGSLRSQGRRGPCSASFASLRSAHSATQGPRRPRLRLPPTPPREELRWRTRSNLLWQFARPEHGVHLTCQSPRLCSATLSRLVGQELKWRQDSDPARIGKWPNRNLAAPLGTLLKHCHSLYGKDVSQWFRKTMLAVA